MRRAKRECKNEVAAAKTETKTSPFCVLCVRHSSSQDDPMTENEIAKIIVDEAFHIHTNLGPGLLETVHGVVLAHEQRKHGLTVEREVPTSIIYDELKFDVGFRADVIVENRVIIELKSVETLMPVHSKQLLTQLRLSNRQLGLLINFGELHLKNGIKRVVNGLPDEPTTI